MTKKIIAVTLIFLMFLGILLTKKEDKYYKVESVISPVEITLESGKSIKYKELDCFDSYYTVKNSNLSRKFGITEDEAYILGNLGKYWSKNILQLRKVKIKDNDIIFNRQKYRTKLENSPYCIKDGKINNEYAFNKQLNTVRKGNFVIVDLDNDKFYKVSRENAGKVKNYVVLRKSHLKNITNIHKSKKPEIKNTYYPIQDKYNSVLDLGNVKIIVSDSTSKTVPDRNCSSDICRELLYQINQTKNTMDIAIYGYSSTPVVEQAIKNAFKRGVKIRMVYDIDSQGNNIYPDTSKIVELIPDNRNDKNSPEVNNTMHNKFYVFDNKTVITGSANLSHTDMSGYNSNAIVVIHSEEVAKFYTDEFNQMYNGKFHNAKKSFPNKKFENISVYFSPQDKGIKNGILPIIRSAREYIYIPSFVITERNLVSELISAINRGVDVKIIVDSLNANNKSSKHRELRDAGIPVKAENYAGKMHSKSIIVDDEYLIIGSMNFSNSGESRNDENLVIIKNTEAAKFYKDFFIYQWSRITDRWLKYIPRAEGKDSVGSCNDGVDNNYDGLKDSEDSACK